ncbi:N-acetylglucosaminyldiphosphodolichol N-acetylglucosaminyltransferase [Aphelenchoides besseyi]|nr:N-acetylglucosaminyldiphosphodolichol N-acetylglucosaminyltransferase [Aphelenchoides besseyi]KAI6235236.1 N-acetylglucosaminyldiphosphodolichol N-acetylglucosaminyltransferase [Aphelenchoides besseyi]
MRLLVTVGTTKFEALILDVMSEKVLSSLSELGFREISLQMGNIDLQEHIKQSDNFVVINQNSETINLRWRDLKIRARSYFFDSMDREMRDADLIISHGGAGTCMEALNLGKPLVVVVNNELMHNHQTELADRLALDNYCLVVHDIKQLPETLRFPNLLKPKPFPAPVDSNVFADYLTTVLDF